MKHAAWCLVAVTALVTAAPSGAATVTVTGADGPTPVGPGEDATAVADGPDASNTATATGGEGTVFGDRPSPRGGNALATAIVQTPGPASAKATAVGGDGADHTDTPPGAGGVGGSAAANADARSSGGFGAQAQATAITGEGGLGTGPFSSGEPGPAPVVSAYAESLLGGSVFASATAGAGNAGNVDGTGTAVNGGSISLHNAALGATPGDMQLVQSAGGGLGGGSFDGAVPGAGGSAESSLVFTTRSQSLKARVGAVGGPGGEILQGNGGVTGHGGDSTAHADLTNESGSLDVQTRSIAGDGGVANYPETARGGGGGDASVVSLGHTVGDNHMLQIGELSQTDRGASEATFGAFAGGSGATPGNRTVHGGNATSVSIGVADGASFVSVGDFARGGDGQFPASGAPPDNSGNSGGSASSHAEGSNTGTPNVSVHAQALGGGGGFARESGSGGDGGAASAYAKGSSSGAATVTVNAEALGGAGGRNLIGGGGPGGIGGAADATAIGTSGGRVDVTALATGSSGGGQVHPTVRADALGAGTSGLTSATATTGVTGGLYLDAVASGPSSAATHALARVGFGDVLPAAHADATAAFAEGAPLLDPATALRIPARLLQGPIAALGTLAVSAPGGGAGADAPETAKVRLGIDYPLGAELKLGVGLLDDEVLSMPFESLEFTIKANGSVVRDDTFDDPAAAAAFFADQVLDLPGLFSGHVDLELALSLVSSAGGAGFATSFFVAPLPEPGPGALLACAFVTLAALAPGWRNWQTRRP